MEPFQYTPEAKTNSAVARVPPNRCILPSVNRLIATSSAEMIRLKHNRIGHRYSARLNGRPYDTAKSRHFLLIRLFQQTTSCSVGACRARHFQRICANSRRSSAVKRLAGNTWKPAAGRRVLRAHAAETEALMNRNRRRRGAGSVPVAGTRFR